MKKIPLTRGQFALVDDADFEFISSFSWHCAANGYAQGYMGSVNGKTVQELMHRLIMGMTTTGQQVDHINKDKLDNRRANLRTATSSQNCHNRVQELGPSGFRGVFWVKANRRWQSNIQVARKKIYIGVYDTALEAARAYNAKALELLGPFAGQNAV